MTAEDEIKRQLNHLRNYEDLSYGGLRTLNIIEGELAEIKQQCQKRDELMAELDKRLQDGRYYLMGVESKKLTVEDALEAFGFGRNGLTT